MEPELCYPHLPNSSCRAVMRGGAEALPLYALLSSVSLLTVGLNLLVLVSISHFRQLRSPTNVLLLSLACSDLLVGLLVMPVEAARLVEACWLLGGPMCALSYILGFTLTSASVGSVVLISADRYVAICHPLRYSARVTLGRARACVGACWFCSVLYNGLILKDHLRSPDRYNSCLGQCLVVIDPTSGAVDLLVTFVGPCAVIVVLYARVFVVAVSQARALRTQVRAGGAGSGGAGAVAGKSERKAARTLGVVVLVFLLCFCPYYTPSLAGQHMSNSALSWAIMSWLLYCNSCLNPLIYAFFYPWFRRSIKMIVTLEILKQGSSQAKVL